MKAHAMVFSLLVGCGAGGGSKSGEDAPADAKEKEAVDDNVNNPEDETAATDPSALPPTFSMVVDTADQLPPCDGAHSKALVYVSGDTEFQTCQNGAWTVIDVRGEQGESGADGTSIASIENLSSGINDLCTRYSNESCLFIGGVTTNYSNGLVQFGGRSYFNYILDDAGDFDSDSYQTTSSINTCKPTDAACWVLIDTIKRIGSDDFRILWLVYTTATDTFHLVYDTDADGVYEATDEVVEELTKSSVYVE